MSKSMCKWKSDDIKKKTVEFCKIVKKPKFYCAKCGRVADSDKKLCKAEKL